MQRLIAPILYAFLSLLFVANAKANLIINGSFEDNQIQNGTWKLFSDQQLSGWRGNNMEIWNNFGAINMFDGNQLLELNSQLYKGQFTGISQSFATEIGQTYDISFAYRARHSNSESFNMRLDSGLGELFSKDFDDHVTGKWATYHGQFIATDTITTLHFNPLIPIRSTVGNLIDNIVVEKRSSTVVAEPQMLLMLALGLVLLTVVIRRRYA
ncbi:hypothetical protein GCM10009092_26810 [Bowmanella denitrificans]|uniref:DUF642 domain-containing protein n=1 Tax=Bowmanella denitrificans TaxID=366582 RepID=A0ABN0XDW0_9ALTE